MFMAEKNKIEIFSEYVKQKGVIVIGLGQWGTKFMEEWSGRIEKIILCDNSLEKQKNGFLIENIKYDIYPVEHIEKAEINDFVIVIASDYYPELFKQINGAELGDVPVFVYPFLESREELLKRLYIKMAEDLFDLKEIKEEKAEYVEKKMKQIDLAENFTIPYVPVLITTRCTLNCESCNNLMPYMKGCAKDQPIEVVERDLKNLLNSTESIMFCELVGGEPFLYTKINELLTFVGEQKKVEQIIIVTNATVIPKQETLDLLKKYNVVVRISDYGFEEKLTKFLGVLEKNEIKHIVYYDMKWLDSGDIRKRNRSAGERYFQYNKCEMSLKCKNLINGKLYTCARISGLDSLGQYCGKEDYLEINESTTSEMIRKFYLHDNGRGCDYCDMKAIDGGKEIPAAIQVKREDVHKYDIAGGFNSEIL